MKTFLSSVLAIAFFLIIILVTFAIETAIFVGAWNWIITSVFDLNSISLYMGAVMTLCATITALVFKLLKHIRSWVTIFIYQIIKN